MAVVFSEHAPCFMIVARHLDSTVTGVSVVPLTAGAEMANGLRLGPNGQGEAMAGQLFRRRISETMS